MKTILWGIYRRKYLKIYHRFNHFENQNIAFFAQYYRKGELYPTGSYEENLNRIKCFNNDTIKAIKGYYPQILMDYPSALENLQKSVDKQYLFCISADIYIFLTPYLSTCLALGVIITVKKNCQYSFAQC